MAFNKGVTIENILKAADWTTDSTFLLLTKSFCRLWLEGVTTSKLIEPKVWTAGVLLNFMENWIAVIHNQLGNIRMFMLITLNFPRVTCKQISQIIFTSWWESWRGLNPSWNQMSEMSKCNTALPPTLTCRHWTCRRCGEHTASYPWLKILMFFFVVVQKRKLCLAGWMGCAHIFVVSFCTIAIWILAL